jgi:hypothetical protein
MEPISIVVDLDVFEHARRGAVTHALALAMYSLDPVVVLRFPLSRDRGRRSWRPCRRSRQACVQPSPEAALAAAIDVRDIRPDLRGDSPSPAVWGSIIATGGGRAATPHRSCQRKLPGPSGNDHT